LWGRERDCEGERENVRERERKGVGESEREWLCKRDSEGERVNVRERENERDASYVWRFKSTEHKNWMKKSKCES